MARTYPALRLAVLLTVASGQYLHESSAFRATPRSHVDCNCDCCDVSDRLEHEKSDDAASQVVKAAAAVTKKCAPVAPSNRCGASCQPVEGGVLTGLSTNEVQAVQFCLIECRPSTAKVGAACERLTPEQRGLARTPDGMGKDVYARPAVEELPDGKTTIRCHEHGSVIVQGSVLRAWYGAPGNEWTTNQGSDVTARVKELQGTGKNSISCDNDHFGDPASWAPKELVVEVVTPTLPAIVSAGSAVETASMNITLGSAGAISVAPSSAAAATTVAASTFTTTGDPNLKIVETVVANGEAVQKTLDELPIATAKEANSAEAHAAVGHAAVTEFDPLKTTQEYAGLVQKEGRRFRKAGQHAFH